MSQWTVIADANIEPGDPIRTIDGFALRDNAAAMAEGAAGAPRVYSYAFNPPVFGDTYTICRVVEGAELVTTESSFLDVGHFRHTPDINRQVGVMVLVAGSVRVTFKHKTDTPSSPSFAKVYLNHALALAIATTQTNYVTRSVDLSVSIGDMITIQHATLVGGGGTVSLTDILIKSGNPDMAVI